MAKATVRIPLDVPPELREEFIVKVKRIDHTLGLNTALRFLMTVVCGMGDEAFTDYIEMGKQYEQQIERGEYKSYRDLYPEYPRDEQKIIACLQDSVKDIEKHLKDIKEFLREVQKEKR